MEPIGQTQETNGRFQFLTQEIPPLRRLAGELWRTTGNQRGTSEGVGSQCMLSRDSNVSFAIGRSILVGITSSDWLQLMSGDTLENRLQLAIIKSCR